MIALICPSCGWITICRTRPKGVARGCAKHETPPIVLQAVGLEGLLDGLEVHLANTLPPGQVRRRVEIARAAWDKRQVLNREDKKSGPGWRVRAKEARRELQKAGKRFTRRRRRFGKL
jgi:hypothetical protein